MTEFRPDGDGLEQVIDYIEAQIEALRTEVSRQFLALWEFIVVAVIAQMFFNLSVVHWVFTNNPLR